VGEDAVAWGQIKIVLKKKDGTDCRCKIVKKEGDSFGNKKRVPEVEVPGKVKSVQEPCDSRLEIERGEKG